MEKLQLTKTEHRVLVSLHLQGKIHWGRMKLSRRIETLEHLQELGLLDSDSRITPAGIDAGAPFNDNVEIV